MIKLIRSNTPSNYVLMLLLMLILWGFKFYYMPTPIETYEIHNWLIPKFPETIFFQYLSSILAFLFLYLFALLLIQYNSKLNIIENSYQCPGIIFILLSGTYINIQRILPETFASFTLFYATIRIFKSYNKNNAYSNMLDAGIFTAISIFLFHKLIFIIPILVLVIFIVRAAKWRDIVIYFLGLLTSVSVGIILIWLYGKPDIFLQSLEFAIETKYNLIRYSSLNSIIFIPILIIAILSIISRYTVIIPRKISTRKFQTSLLLILIVLSIFFISPHSTNEAIILLYPFLSLLFTNIIINAKQIYIYIIFWGFVISILFSQIIQIFYYISLY